VTASSDGVYVGMIQSPNVGSCKILWVSNSVQTDPIGNCKPQSCNLNNCNNVPLPSGSGVCINAGLLGYYETLYTETRGLAYDSRGYIWMADGSSALSVFDTSMQLYKPVFTWSTVQDVEIVQKARDVYHAYLIVNSNSIAVYDVSTFPILGFLSENQIIRVYPLNSLSYPGQIAVDDLGNMYVTERDFDFVVKVTSDGLVTRSDAVTPAIALDRPHGIATYGSFVFVTNRVSATAANLKVLNSTDLSLVTTISVYGTNAPAPSVTQYEGFWDIDIDSDGKIYIADNTWDYKTSYLPPGGTAPGQTITGRIYFDRIIVGQL
jgi:hypothetical protein